MPTRRRPQPRRRNDRPMAPSALTGRPAWLALEAHAGQMRDVHLRALFASDASRGSRLAVEAAGLYLDYSKNRVTAETIRLLLALADECGLRQRIDAMFRGDRINTTEGRAVLHVALRAPRGDAIVLDGENVVPRVHDVLDRDQYRHRRIGSRSGHGVRGAQALQCA
jgi:glucose-6-phosphate isomerase